MPYQVEKQGLTFDDVLMIPQFLSKIKSRSEVDLSTPIFNHYSLDIPIISANMDTVTEDRMAIKMAELGGMGILHRYATVAAVNGWIENMHRADATPIVPSIGIGHGEVEKGIHYWKVMGADAICIDIAHGDCQGMLDTIKALKDAGVFRVVAGNVATAEAFSRLASAGADAIKVGIGPGSLCTTRIVTGHGVPQLTAIKNCNMAKFGSNVKLIADGGIRTSGDIVKALAFGADAVMVGNLLAGTEESPGEVREEIVSVDNVFEAKLFKQYRGMASREARATQADVSNYTPEGEAMLMPYKGPVEAIVKNLVGGMRSGLTYSGAPNLAHLREFSCYCIISSNSVRENGPHGKL